MTSKPARYGLKVWALCDVKTAYAWKMEIYTEKPPGGRHEANIGMRVVLGLTDSLRGHEVTTDNFFTSIHLAKELFCRNHPMQKNGASFSNKTNCRKAGPPQPLLFYQGADTFFPKKGENVLVLSTKHKRARGGGC